MKKFALIVIGITIGVLISAVIVGQYKEALIAGVVLVAWLIFFNFIRKRELDSHSGNVNHLD